MARCRAQSAGRESDLGDDGALMDYLHPVRVADDLAGLDCDDGAARATLAKSGIHVNKTAFHANAVPILALSIIARSHAAMLSADLVSRS